MGAHADETTVSADTARTGWDPASPRLSPSQVTSANFGQLFAASVDGQVYAQPIVVGSTVIVATENNNVYGLNSVTGAVKWTVNLGPAWPASAIGCGDLSPNVGVTSTPVYDPGTGYVYLTAKVNDGADAQHPHYYMHALNPATGAEETGWPVTIAGAASNDPGYAFSAFTQLQRPGLLLMGGSVYAAFSGHCDLGTYAGFVAGVNTSTKAMSLWTDEPVPSSDEAGIWQSGGGLVSDGPGRIFVATGNGVSPGTAPGSSPPSRARRVRGPARRGRRRHHVRTGLLQPDQRVHPRHQRPGPRLRRPGGAARLVRHLRLSAPDGAGRQGRQGVPAEPRRSRRQRPGQQRRR